MNDPRQKEMKMMKPAVVMLFLVIPVIQPDYPDRR
jgi:hypothetical protein